MFAAKCDFEQQTENLVMNAFTQNLHDKTVRTRLCIEPKEHPQEEHKL